MFATLLLAALGTTGLWVACERLSAPSQRNVGDPPAGLGARSVEFRSASGAVIHGWLASGRPGVGAVLLLHGVRGDRRDMLARATFLHAAGYAVLLIDLQAHGASRGQHITFGYLESRDVAAALALLEKEFPRERIGVIGTSMGAAAFVLARDRPTVSAVVLESMYPTIDQALADRLRLHLGPLGPPLAPLFEMLLRPQVGITAADLRPIDRMSGLGAPVFIIAGTRDDHTTPQETRAIFAAAAQPKQLWWIQGAAHVDLYEFAGREYEARILEYFAAYLRTTTAGSP